MRRTRRLTDMPTTDEPESKGEFHREELELSKSQRAAGWTVRELGGVRVKVFDLDKVGHIHLTKEKP